jgi:hypothetical protein
MGGMSLLRYFYRRFVRFILCLNNTTLIHCIHGIVLVVDSMGKYLIFIDLCKFY